MLDSLKNQVIKLLEKKDFLKSLKKTDFEIPQNYKWGHLSLPVFKYSKQLKKSPNEIASELSEYLNKNKDSFLEKAQAVSGYLNLHFKKEIIQELLEKAYLEDSKNPIGFSKDGLGKKLLLDLASPNVAKPMSIGHLRASIIGQALLNLAKSQSYEAISLNHLGDWGTQFGKLIYAYERWGKDYDFKDKALYSLYELYVKFHKEAEKDESLNEKASFIFKKLEKKDEKLLKLWKYFTDLSLKEYERIWSELGIKHDLVIPESFYNDQMNSLKDLLLGKKLLQKSKGALVVDLSSFNMPACLIEKTDGTSLYASRDLASAIYRKKNLQFDLNLYVTGREQKLHFEQIFKVLDLLGFKWVKDCKHIIFGMYLFKKEKISTRKGNLIFLEDILKEANLRAYNLIKDKKHIKDKKKTAQIIANGAIIFNDLISDSNKDIQFNWSKILDFQGDSGVYVQYTYVRSHSLLKKAKKELKGFKSTLNEEIETDLMKKLIQYDEVLKMSFLNFKAHHLATYLIDLSSLFNQFYQKCPVLENPDRLFLTQITRKILKSGLSILNIKVPENM